MIVSFFPSTGGTICIIGFDADDTTRMMSRKSEPATINFNDAVEVGIAVPTYLQIIYVKDRAEFDKRIEAWLRKLGIDPTGKMLPLEQMPRPFEEGP